MKLPAFLYGRGRDARRETKKVITRLRRGLTLPEAVDDLGGLLDVDDHPGWIILGGPNPVASARDGFHLYRLLVELEERHREDLLEPLKATLFESLIARDWGVALLLSSRGSYFVWNHENTLANGRYHRLLDAACAHWPAFEAVGPRWSENGSQLDRPLPCSRTLEIVLLRCNIPFETIQAERHLGLPELLRRHPPEPESFHRPASSPARFANEEEQRAALRKSFIETYDLLVEIHRPGSKKLARARARTDAEARQDGFDPADLDPHWHQRPQAT